MQCNKKFLMYDAKLVSIYIWSMGSLHGVLFVKESSNITALLFVFQKHTWRSRLDLHYCWIFFWICAHVHGGFIFYYFMHLFSVFWWLIKIFALYLKTFGALWPQQSMLIQSHKHWKHSSVDFAKPGDQFLWQLFKILFVLCLTDWNSH